MADIPGNTIYKAPLRPSLRILSTIATEIMGGHSGQVDSTGDTNHSSRRPIERNTQPIHGTDTNANTAGMHVNNAIYLMENSNVWVNTNIEARNLLDSSTNSALDLTHNNTHSSHLADNTNSTSLQDHYISSGGLKDNTQLGRPLGDNNSPRDQVFSAVKPGRKLDNYIILESDTYCNDDPRRAPYNSVISGDMTDCRKNINRTNLVTRNANSEFQRKGKVVYSSLTDTDYWSGSEAEDIKTASVSGNQTNSPRLTPGIDVPGNTTESYEHLPVLSANTPTGIVETSANMGSNAVIISSGEKAASYVSVPSDTANQDVLGKEGLGINNGNLIITKWDDTSGRLAGSVAKYLIPKDGIITIKDWPELPERHAKDTDKAVAVTCRVRGQAIVEDIAHDEKAYPLTMPFKNSRGAKAKKESRTTFRVLGKRRDLGIPNTDRETSQSLLRNRELNRTKTYSARRVLDFSSSRFDNDTNFSVHSSSDSDNCSQCSSCGESNLSTGHSYCGHRDVCMDQSLRVNGNISVGSKCRQSTGSGTGHRNRNENLRTGSLHTNYPETPKSALKSRVAIDSTDTNTVKTPHRPRRQTWEQSSALFPTRSHRGNDSKTATSDSAPCRFTPYRPRPRPWNPMASISENKLYFWRDLHLDSSKLVCILRQYSSEEVLERYGPFIQALTVRSLMPAKNGEVKRFIDDVPRFCSNIKSLTVDFAEYPESALKAITQTNKLRKLSILRMFAGSLQTLLTCLMPLDDLRELDIHLGDEIEVDLENKNTEKLMMTMRTFLRKNTCLRVVKFSFVVNTPMVRTVLEECPNLEYLELNVHKAEDHLDPGALAVRHTQLSTLVIHSNTRFLSHRWLQTIASSFPCLQTMQLSGLLSG